jgi:hypothetical protein
MARQLGDDASELTHLQRAEAAGVAVAPMVVVPEHVEGDFYRWNNLPARLLDLFAALHPTDPDDEELEELVPTAQTWVMEHALLDGVIDNFYEACAELPARLQVRRPGEGGVVALRGRPALIAVKRCWAADWTLAAVLSRAQRGVGWLPEPRPVLLHSSALAPDAALGSAASTTLGTVVQAWSDERGRIARLALSTIS